MKKGRIKVEQIDSSGNIVIDYDEILKRSELVDVINSLFKTEYNNNLCYGTYNLEKFAICFKNISYLGIPHATYKKRIQIPKSFIEYYNFNKTLNIKTLFIGVYSFNGNIIFVDFDTEKYVFNSGNNSSAHVLSIDLYNAHKKGIYSKKDSRNNVVTCFTPNNIDIFLKHKLKNSVDLRSNIIQLVDQFYDSIQKTWYGIDCYDEMEKNDFNQRHQAEWPGFYLEFKFSQFLDLENRNNHIIYKQNKKKNEIDLDLFFPEINTYGDLKAHSLSSQSIQGNDYETIINTVQKSSIYYIVFNHKTFKDKDNEFKVTNYWNKKLKKNNLMSYAKKMKASIEIENYMVLEINQTNLRYLSEFNQGINSNGLPRNKKILITKKNIDNFLIHSYSGERS